MNGFLRIFQFIRILIFLGCLVVIGIVFFVLFVIYDPTEPYFGGRAQSYAPYGVLAIVLSVVVIFILLNVKKPIKDQALQKKLHIIIVVIGIIGIIAYIPYQIFPIQAANIIKQEFTTVYGSDWESRIQPPQNGSWTPNLIPWDNGILDGYVDERLFDTIWDQEYLKIGNDSFRFNAYIPKSPGLHPAILNMHGGGWRGGDKNWDNTYRLKYMAAAGYVIFSIDYGAIDEFNIEKQYNMSDICANIAKFSDWLAIYGNNATFKTDLSKIFISGSSAGGHLSALMAVGRFNVSQWNPAIIIIAGIHYYPPVNFSAMNPMIHTQLYTWGIFNASIEERPDIWVYYSPISYVSAEDCPNLILQGEMDSTVYASEVREFAQRCDEVGMKSVYLEIPKAEHGFEGNAQRSITHQMMWSLERFCQLVLADL